MSFSCSLTIPKIPEQQVKRHSIHGITEGVDIVKPHQEIGHLSVDEKHYLLAVERGDIVSVDRVLQHNNHEERLGIPIHQRRVNINCVDPLGRSAILMTIDNENYEMLKLLINNNVDTKDALLYAVSEEFVEAVELLLDSEEEKWKVGEPHIWERKPHDTAIFTSDITPLVLAAHRDNYEIIKILLDKGACLSIPHDSRCNCEECVTLSSEDSLLYSYSRINSYRALASPFLIVLSSKDPILTAFELSWALRRLSKTEHEFKSDYQELRMKCQKFASDLLNHTRSSTELEILLNYNVDPESRIDIKAMRLDRLKLAIKLKQKEFVAHPNVQQLLASIWYAGLPGFRRKNTIQQSIEVLKIGLSFPIFSIIYIFAPRSQLGQMLRSPFIKFICHSASYFIFLFLTMMLTMISRNDSFKKYMMFTIAAFVFGLIWNETKTLWRDGLEEYLTDSWNIIDFIATSLYLCDIAVKIFFNYTEKGLHALQTFAHRDQFDIVHPKLASEALFSTANIFSTLKIVYIFSINPYLGPLQIVLARVILDIAKFFLVYVLVLLAFSNGIHNLLSPYSELQRKVCWNEIVTNYTKDEVEQLCKDTPYVKFFSLFETTQVLFWTAFGEIHLDFFSLYTIQETTKIWGMVMYGTYCVICLVVLLNLLIAMMDHSYNKIFDDADVEWKFARSKLWISFFEEGGTAPVPFNIIPSPKSFWYLLRWIFRKLCPKSQAEESRSKSIQNVMRNLVQRYVIARQKSGNENNAVTEDDINEVKQEVLTFRSDLIQILRESGMKAKRLNECSAVMAGKKKRFRERRLIKGLNMESESVSDSLELTEAELEKSLLEDDKREFKNPFSDLFQPILHGTPKSIFKKNHPKKKKALKKFFSKAMAKSNGESNDDTEDVKTPDSVQTNYSFDKKIWFTELSTPNIVQVDADDTPKVDKDLRYIDDSLELHDRNRY